MQDEIVKWIEANGTYIKQATLYMGIGNLILLGLIGATGGLGYYIVHIFNILFFNLAIFIPVVYAVKNLK